MKNISIILTVFLSSCSLFLDGGVVVFHMENTYYNTVYIEPPVLLNTLDQNNITQFNYNKRYGVDIFIPRSVIYTINFYQDQEQNCYLFSMTNKELFDMEKKFSKSHKGQTPIFLIEKDGIRVIAMDEYEQIKSKLKPHPYDSSLCKPKPINE